MQLQSEIIPIGKNCFALLLFQVFRTFVICIGVLLLIFGTTYIVVGRDTVGTYIFEPIWYVLAGLSPFRDTVVIFVDYTLNAIGIALVILGVIFATIPKGKTHIRKIASAILIAIGALSAFAGYLVYGIYLSLPIFPHPLEPYFPATNVPLLGMVYLIPLFQSLMIDGALFIASGLILLLLGRNSSPIFEKNEHKRGEKLFSNPKGTISCLAEIHTTLKENLAKSLEILLCRYIA